MKGPLLKLLGVMVAASVALHCNAQSKADRKVMKHLQTDIAYLASDDLEGRRTGSAGEKKAADYIAQRYEEDGISPYLSSYAHSFHFIYGKSIAGTTQIKIGGNMMHIPDEAFPLPYSGGQRVFSDILPDVMEQGNIWLVPLYSEQAEADDPHFDWKAAMHKQSAAAEKEGASGILFYDGWGSKWPPTFDILSDYKPLTIPAAFLSHEAYARYVQGNDANNGNQRGTIPVDLNITVEKTDRTGTNVAAYIDNKAINTVIIGAHYDHLGRGEDGNSMYTGKDHAIHNGADDNASGTAALLAIAGWIKKTHLRHYNYLLVGFSGGDLGALGSAAFIKERKLDSAHIACMINVDMIGRLDTANTLFISGTSTSPAWPAIINKQDKELKIVTDKYAPASDHLSFYKENIPVLSFSTGMHPDYRKPSDKADKINYAGAVSVIKYIQKIIADLDKTPKPGFIANVY